MMMQGLSGEALCGFLPVEMGVISAVCSQPQTHPCWVPRRDRFINRLATLPRVVRSWGPCGISPLTGGRARDSFTLKRSDSVRTIAERVAFLLVVRVPGHAAVHRGMRMRR